MDNRKLDLHGVRHPDVDRLVENFILMNQQIVPLTIVCGNSQRMIDIVTQTVERIKVDRYTMDRYGVIVIAKI